MAQSQTTARYTVCPAVVGSQTSYIMWNDAEQAAATGAPAVSPYKPGSPSDREWTRFYNRARTAPSGITPKFGHRVLTARPVSS
jgi:hypothetical protein